MKKFYLTPAIRIQAIDAGDFMETVSIPIFDNNNPETPEGIEITDGTEVLGNGSSVWDEEE